MAWLFTRGIGLDEKRLVNRSAVGNQKMCLISRRQWRRARGGKKKLKARERKRKTARKSESLERRCSRGFVVFGAREAFPLREHAVIALQTDLLREIFSMLLSSSLFLFLCLFFFFTVRRPFVARRECREAVLCRL